MRPFVAGMLALAGALPGFLVTAPAMGAGDPARGRDLAVACAACHGPDGNSPSPTFPRLAGQHEEYLLLAMESYLDGRRTDAIMLGAIQTIDRSQFADLAAWYASQTGLGASGAAGTAPEGAALAAAGTTVGPETVAGAGVVSIAASAPTGGCPDPAASASRDRDRDGVADRDDAAPNDPAEFARDTDGDGAFEICTIGQLQAIRTMGMGRGQRTRLELDTRLARSYELVADLDASAIENFLPIGDCGPENSCLRAGDRFGFAGTFEGHGHAVRNLRIDRPDAGGVGLIGVLRQGGTVRNLAVLDARIRAGNGAGAVVGANFGMVSDVRASGEVQARAAAGMVVGGNAGTVARSQATGRVSGEAALGGLVGDMRGIITDSWADVRVSGNKGIGGLVGLNTFGRVLNSFAVGPVEALENVGGLVGMNTDALVISSFATGPVTSTGTNVGGLVGFNSISKVRNSFASGPVSGRAAVGSLVGRNNGEVAHSYATGTVTGQTAAGGLIGDGQQGTVVP